MPETHPAGVLFDLDGTLADTAPDLADALNRVLADRGWPRLPLHAIRPQVSHGGKALIRLGFGIAPGDPRCDPLRRELLDIYHAGGHRGTRLFPGMEELLEALEDRAVPWGVVTNKPAWLTEPLMARLGLERRASCVVSGDTTPHAKPHPEPVRYACGRMERAANACWYLGDAQRDIDAGRSAGTRTLVALFGYLGAGDRPETWGADGMIRQPLELLEWLRP